MSLSIRARQVIGVTSIVGMAVVALGAMYVSEVARVRLESSQAAGELLASAIYHRARAVAAASPDPYAALGADPGMRSMLEASAYSPNVTYAAIVDPNNTAIAHSDAELVGLTLPVRPALADLLEQDAWAQLRAIYADKAATLEIRRALLSGQRHFGTIRIGVSTLLTRADIDAAIRPAALTALAAVIIASLVAMLLARSLLRPIHLIHAGISRLGRGEFGVTVDVTGSDELGDLGGSVNTLSERLSADRAAATDLAPPAASAEERLENTRRHARHLAAMTRLTAGVAHELRNPLNAIAIHLELLSQCVSAAQEAPASESAKTDPTRIGATGHIEVIRSAVAKLDEMLKRYLKFARPEDVNLQPVALAGLVDELLPIVGAEAQRAGIEVRIDVPAGLPAVLGDAVMLRQALLNLALNALQAMPSGGRLELEGRAQGGQVELVVSDTGSGIEAEDLPRVFDLYFTKKPGGSGMGLSMVYRTVRLHDGEIEVDSSPGAGTAFRILLPRA